MFSKNHMTVGDWWLFFILSVIPLVNLIVWVMILLSSSANKSLKNYLLAIVLPFVIIFGILFATGMFAGFMNSIA